MSQGYELCDFHAQSRVNEMVARNYNVNLIAQELGQYIRDPARNGSLQCYDSSHKPITCAANQLCWMRFYTRERRVTERGCDNASPSNTMEAQVFDGQTTASLYVTCNRDHCNDDDTLAQVKSILYKHGVTTADGRMVGGASKGIVSLFLMIFCLLVTVYTCFAQ